MGTRIGYGVALVAGLATILGWLERSRWVRELPNWLDYVVSQPWFPLGTFTVMILALIGVALSRLRTLESMQKADHADVLSKVNSLETRVWQELNSGLGQTRDQLQTLARRVTKLEPGLSGIVAQIQDQREETYKVVSIGGAIREWKRGEIDDLPEAQRSRLLDEHQDLSDWWLGIEVEVGMDALTEERDRCSVCSPGAA